MRELSPEVFSGDEGVDGEQGLGVGLAMMVHALDRRKAALLDELRRVEQDREAAVHTLEAAERLGFGSAATALAPTGRVVDFPVQTKAPTSHGCAAQSAAQRIQDVPRVAEGHRWPSNPIPASPAEDFQVHREALATLGPLRNDKEIPPAVEVVGKKKVRIENIGLSTAGIELAAIRDSLKSLAAKVAQEPPDTGERRFKPVGQLVPGEPMAPTLRRILRTADRPLTSHELAVTFLEIRGVHLEGEQLIGLTNRVSGFLAQEAGRKNVKGADQEGKRQKLWTWVGTRGHEPSSLPG